MSYKNCPSCGRLIEETTSVCPHCGAILPQQSNDATVNENGNTSGMGEAAEVPYEVEHRYSWGAFFFSWIWAIVYQKYILALIVFVSTFIPFVTLGLSIWMGTKGNKWAWQNRKYKSVEDFHTVHKKWATVGLVFTLFTLLFLLCIVAAMILPFLMSSNTNELKIVAAKKATSLLHQSAQLAGSKNIKTQGYTSEAIADYFSQTMKGTKSGDTISNSYGMVFKFVSDGACNNENCYVEVDTNGVKGPNQLWEDKDVPKDIIRIPLRATNGNQVNVYLPEVLNNNAK